MPTSPANANRSMPLVPGILTSLPNPDGKIDAGDRAQLAFTAREPFDVLDVGAGIRTIRGRLATGVVGRGFGGTVRGRL